jgi:hypothetical protein
MHNLSDEKLKGLIIEETGAGGDSTVTGLILSCIKAIKKYAVFTTRHASPVVEMATGRTGPAEPGGQNGIGSNSAVGNGSSSGIPPKGEGIGLNLAYTINLNLPATSDIAVFNAIFKSLKENLLKGSND